MHFTITSLTVPLTILLMAWVIYYAQKKASTTILLENGDTVLKCHIVFGILGYACGLLLLFFLGLGLYMGWGFDEEKSWLSSIFAIITTVAILYGFVFLTFYYRRHQVVFNDVNIEVFDAWGRSKRVHWGAIKNAEINVNMQEIRLYTEDGTCLKMSLHLYGLDVFRAEMYKHKPYLVQRIIAS